MTTQIKQPKSPKFKYKENEHGYLVLGNPFLYAQYKKGKKNPIPRKQWTEIVRDTMTEVWRAMAEELWRFELPYINNEIFIIEIMGEGVPTNWRMSVKKRKHIKISNLHTNGRVFKITMRRTHNSDIGTRVYKFVPHRGESKTMFLGKRGLGAYIKKCSEDLTIPDFRGHIC